MTTDWVKLHQWVSSGETYYALPGKSWTPLGQANVGERVRLKTGVEISLRMPDGTVFEHQLDVRKENGYYSEGGRTCGVTKEWYGFNIDYYGLKFWVSITDVEVSKAEMEALAAPRCDD